MRNTNDNTPRLDFGQSKTSLVTSNKVVTQAEIATINTSCLNITSVQILKGEFLIYRNKNKRINATEGNRKLLAIHQKNCAEKILANRSLIRKRNVDILTAILQFLSNNI